MNNMRERPKNMSRVLLASNDYSILEFGFFKDGLFRTDSQRHLNNWRMPVEFDGWIDIKEVKFKLDILRNTIKQ